MRTGCAVLHPFAMLKSGPGGCDRENVEDGSILDQKGCGHLHTELEECLAENERDWRRCQPQVKAFGKCYASWQQRQQQQPQPPQQQQPQPRSLPKAE